MKPVGHVVGAPARAALRGRVHAAEARRLGHQLAAPPRNRCARSAPSSAKPTSAPPWRIWRAATAWPGGPRRNGWRTSLTSGRSRRKRASASAFALWRASRSSSVGERAVQQPGLERPGDRAALPAVRAQRLRPRGVAHADRAEDQVASGRRAPSSRCASTRRRRGRAGAGRAAWRACCRPRAARRPRAPRRPPPRCRRRRSAGLAGVSTHTSVAPGTRRRSRRCRSARSAPRRRAARAGRSRRRARPGSRRTRRRARRRRRAPAPAPRTARPCPEENSTLSASSSAPSAASTAVHVGLPARP